MPPVDCRVVNMWYHDYAVRAGRQWIETHRHNPGEILEVVYIARFLRANARIVKAASIFVYQWNGERKSWCQWMTESKVNRVGWEVFPCVPGATQTVKGRLHLQLYQCALFLRPVWWSTFSKMSMSPCFAALRGSLLILENWNHL